MSAYKPSAANLAAFPGLQALADRGTRISNGFRRRPPQTLRVLPGGQLYFDSRLELDTDGWPGGRGKGDKTYQGQTSYRLADRTSIDANRVPYFVLPQPVEWPKQFGIWLGDVAAVIFDGRLAFAVFADFGGEDSIGEGSIELLRRLGMERLKNGRIVNAGTPPGVVTIVFPGSRPALKYTSMTEVILETEKRGKDHFENLLGVGGASTGGRAAAVGARGLAAQMVAFARSELHRFGGVREDREPLNSRIAEYWQAIGRNLSGKNRDQAWSAAFTSFVVRTAGGEGTFRFGARHSAYVYQAIHDKEEGRPGRFWGYRPNAIAIAPGDILAMNRGAARTIGFEEARNNESYSSHADLVVNVANGKFETIGGNVGADTVGEKTFQWDDSGRLVRSDDARQQVFAVLRPPSVLV